MIVNIINGFYVCNIVFVECVFVGLIFLFLLIW